MSEEFVALSDIIVEVGKNYRVIILDKLKRGGLESAVYIGGDPTNVVAIKPTDWIKMKPTHLKTTRKVDNTRRRDNIYLEVQHIIDDQLNTLRELLRAAKSESSQLASEADPEHRFMKPEEIPSEGKSVTWQKLHDGLVEKLIAIAAYDKRAPVYVPLAAYEQLQDEIAEAKRREGGRPRKVGNDAFWLTIMEQIGLQRQRAGATINVSRIVKSMMKTQEQNKSIYSGLSNDPIKEGTITERINQAIAALHLES